MHIMYVLTQRYEAGWEKLEVNSTGAPNFASRDLLVE